MEENKKESEKKEEYEEDIEELEKQADESYKLKKELKKDKFERFKQKAVLWLKNPYNLTFVGIILFAIVIRLYYFTLTMNQPLWWDEAEYMSAAKGYAGILDYKIGGIRLPGYPLLMSLFFIFGLSNEVFMRFIALFIPSIIVLILTYVMINEMYSDKRIALISTMIFAVLWEHLFYSNRFHTENFALIFEFLAIFVLFFCYIKRNDFYIIKEKYSLIWIFAFLVISALFRPGTVVFIPGMFLFLIFINKSRIFQKKHFPILALITVSLIIFGIFIVTSPNTGLLYAMHLDEPLGWNSLSVFYGFYQSFISYIPPLFFYAFLLGLLIFAFDFYIYFPKIKNFNNSKNNLILKSDIFNILLILSVMFFFVGIIRANSFEYRWFFPLLPGMLAFTSKGTIIFSEFIGKLLNNKKTISLLLILIIVGLGVYTQINHADNIIKVKVNSYQQVKDSGLWMKENSNKDDIILSTSFTQHMYYSEREVYSIDSFPEESNFTDFIIEKNPKYLVLSIFQVHQDWVYQWPQKNLDLVFPAQVYYLDEQQQQMALVVYEFKQTQ